MKLHSHKIKEVLQDADAPSFNNPDLADVIEQNIQTIAYMRREYERHKSTQDRVSDAITSFSGSMLFVYLHGLWFLIWIAINLGWVGLRPFDPFPFGLLTMIVSLEAIFLSTFVLVSQNRMAALSDQRADLDLQINLLAEHEITRILTLVDAIADKLGCTTACDLEIEELKKPTMPDAVMKEIEERGKG